MPLWRAGPAGPKSLCNACGIRFNKKGPRQPSPPSSASSATVGSGKEDFSPRSEACVEEMKDGKFRKKLRIKIVALGKEVVLIQRLRSPMKKVVRKHFRNIQIQNQYKNLGEVEQAAHLLMCVLWATNTLLALQREANMGIEPSHGARSHDDTEMHPSPNSTWVRLEAYK
nr:GATA transcription factor 17 [Tanacetum cinerariifolium]